MEENKKWRRHCLPYNLVLCYWCRGDRTTFSPSSLHKYWHWKKKLLNSIFHYRKRHVIDHEFFLNDVMTWSSKPLHSVICQALIGDHRKLQILDDLISEFSKPFDFLTVVRLLNSFQSQDHRRAVQNVVSCMNYHIHLPLKAGKSRTDVLKTFKTSPLVWDSVDSFGLTPFHADFIDYVKYDIDVKDIPKLNKVFAFETTLHKITTTNNDPLYVSAFSYNLSSADILSVSPQAYHQLYSGSSELDDDEVVVNLKQQLDMTVRHTIKIPIDHYQSNLPIISNTACTKKEVDKIGPHFKSVMTSFNHNLVFTDHFWIRVWFLLRS